MPWGRLVFLFYETIIFFQTPFLILSSGQKKLENKRHLKQIYHLCFIYTSLKSNQAVENDYYIYIH